MAVRLLSRELDKRIRFEIQDEGDDEDILSAGTRTWSLFAEVWASVVDKLPSGATETAEGIAITARRSRIRIRPLPGLLPTMRIVFGDRTMRIDGDVAVLGSNEGIELMAEDFSTAGESA